MATYSDALKEAYASAPNDQIIFDTLEIRHPAFVDERGHVTAARIVAGFDDITATLEPHAPMDGGKSVRFTAMPIDIQLPGFEENKTPELIITLDNVGRDLMGYLEAAASDPRVIEITYRPYLLSDLSEPQMDPPINMIVTGVQADVFRVQITASMDDVNNWAFPHRLYQPSQFPGLVR